MKRMDRIFRIAKKEEIKHKRGRLESILNQKLEVRGTLGVFSHRKCSNKINSVLMYHSSLLLRIIVQKYVLFILL